MRGFVLSSIVLVLLAACCHGRTEKQYDSDHLRGKNSKDDNYNLRDPENNLLVEPTSKYCKALDGKLSCDFTATKETVILGAQSRQKRDTQSQLYKSVEIRSASVFHLAESACLEDISIRDTKKVIVDDSYHTKSEADECPQYRLSLINSTITNIPLTVTELNVDRSTIEKLVTHPSLLLASIAGSQVEYLTTEISLNRRSVVNITNTQISLIDELKMTDNNTFSVSSSNLTFTHVENINYGHNLTEIKLISSLMSDQPLLFTADPGVEFAIDAARKLVTFKHLTGTLLVKKTTSESCPEHYVLIPKPDEREECTIIAIFFGLLSFVLLIILVIVFIHSGKALYKCQIKCPDDPEQNKISNRKSCDIQKEEQNQPLCTPRLTSPKPIPGTSVKKRSKRKLCL